MDKLKAASLSKKINELQNRVLELHEHAEEQLHLLEVFSRHLTYLEEEIENENLDGEGQVSVVR